MDTTWTGRAQNAGLKPFSLQRAPKFGRVLRNRARYVRQRINPSRDELGGYDEHSLSLSNHELAAAFPRFPRISPCGPRNHQISGVPGKVGIPGHLSTWVPGNSSA